MIVGLGLSRRLMAAVACVSMALAGTRVDADGGPSVVSSSVTCPINRQLPPGHYVFDFRSVPLRAAISLLGLTGGPKAVGLDSIPDTGPLNLCLNDFTVEEAWLVLLRQNHLAVYDIDGVRYAGTEQDLALRFPGARIRDVRVFSFEGDVSGSGDFSKALQDAVPGTAVFIDRINRTLTVFGSKDELDRASQIVSSMLSQSATRIGAFTSVAIPIHNQRTDDIYASTIAALGAVQAPNTVVNAADVQSILVSGTPDFVFRAKTIIASLDQRVPMVRLDVTVVSITPNNDNSDFGFQFGGVDVNGVPQSASYNTTTVFSNKALKINATLNAEIQKGDASVLSRGALYARNGKKAEIKGQVGYPYISTASLTTASAVTVFNTGADIAMTPTLLNGGILVNLDAAYASLNDFTAQQIPIISNNEYKGDLMVSDDEALVIVGLYNDVSSQTLSKIPLAGDLPLVGPLFRNKQTSRTRTEVAFVVVPHRGSEIDAAAVKAQPIGRPAILDFAHPMVSMPTPPPPATPAPVRPLFH